MGVARGFLRKNAAFLCVMVIFAGLGFRVSAEASPALPEMILVPGGSFAMGSSMLSDDEKPQHPVTLSPFYISKYEVTVGEFAQFVDTYFMGSTMVDLLGVGWIWNGEAWEAMPGASWNKPQFEQGDSNPVVLVAWDDAVMYCNYVSTLAGLDEVYVLGKNSQYEADFSKNGYRLPTEAEWEYAASGGQPGLKDRTRYIGSNHPETTCWLASTSGGKTHPVGTKQPNQLGIFDMGGNAAEWCGDWYGPYSKDAATDPHGPASGKGKVIRGGCFISNNVDWVMPTYRDWGSTMYAWNSTGFRLARSSSQTTALALTTTTTTTLAPRPASLIDMQTVVDGGTYSGKPVKSFLIGTYEVTAKQFSVFVEATGYKTTAESSGGGFVFDLTNKKWDRKSDATWKNPYFTPSPLLPVVHMSWYDAVEFCNWLSGREGLDRVYAKQGNTWTADAGKKGYRLPSEQEWEFAAKGGLKSRGFKYAGSEKGETVAWSSDFKATSPHSGGFLPPNELGIFDMCGNVWEWAGELIPQTDKPGTFKAALRGGSWTNTAEYCTIDRRITDAPEGTDFTFGFRVARTR